MASVDALPRSRRLVLDAGAILALARGDGDTRAAVERARREGYVVVIPTPVLAQVHRGGRDRAWIDRVVNAVDALLPTTAAVARRAGELLARSNTTDAVDAIVAAEALVSTPALILTSDPDDLMRLVDGQPEASDLRIDRDLNPSRSVDAQVMPIPGVMPGRRSKPSSNVATSSTPLLSITAAWIASRTLTPGTPGGRTPGHGPCRPGSPAARQGRAGRRGRRPRSRGRPAQPGIPVRTPRHISRSSLPSLTAPRANRRSPARWAYLRPPRRHILPSWRGSTSWSDGSRWELPLPVGRDCGVWSTPTCGRGSTSYAPIGQIWMRDAQRRSCGLG